MQRMRHLTLGVMVGIMALLLCAGVSSAQISQTIVIDGVNDFLEANLLESEPDDTYNPEEDIRKLYVTNDAVSLFFGIEYDEGGWDTNQLGIAVDVDPLGGGSTDPWGRQLEWTLAFPSPPDFMFYVNLDNNWQEGMWWNGDSWERFAQGPNALGWATETGFKELEVLLSRLGVAADDEIYVEAWMTQDRGNAGPYDAVANDASQMSTPEFRQDDTDTPIPMFFYLPFTILPAVDLDPPVISQTRLSGTDFPAESFFDVVFNEPMDPETSQNPANYALSGGGGGGAAVIGATQDPTALNVIHLEVAPAMTASGNLYTVTVSNVEDANGNEIQQNGIDNLGCFMLKHLLFRGFMSEYLAGLPPNTDPPDTFTIEGDILPLTFTPLCDTGFMTDTGSDDIWEFEDVFHISGDCQEGTASQELEWKCNHECGTWESIPGNRVHDVNLVNGPSDVLEFWWSDEDPTTFTEHAIDVEFFVDMSLSAYMSGDDVGIDGDVAPLNWNVPSENLMLDDGQDPDETAGDEVFAIRVRFPAGTRKDVEYKFLLNDSFECELQGNREVFLNDAEYDTVGGDLGPLTLPVVYYDFCNTLFRAVEVIFQCDMNGTAWEDLLPGDVISVNGTPNNADPPTFDWSIPSLNPLNDSGAYPDQTAGDNVWSASVVFPDTSQQNIEYKYLYNEDYECQGFGNRTVSIDPVNHDAAGNPQILPVDKFQNCYISGIQELPDLSILEQNRPNPFNPKTEIRFVVRRSGEGSLRIFNARGELVRTLLSGQIPAGAGTVIWDGLGDDGKRVSSGVYIYCLEVGGSVDTKRMVLLK